MIGLRPGRAGRIVALGAHCDDLAIGAGATLLTLGATRVDALVLSGGGTSREPRPSGRGSVAFTGMS
ncbi:hypothetical protein AB0K48_50265, partial [Nonomuraea sp. NPDC055795]